METNEYQDAWPDAWEHNKPLFEAMIADGFTFKSSDGLANFVNEEGGYAPFPTGYVTYGICFNGSPNPHYASVMLANGTWSQRSYPGHRQCLEWAMPYAEEVLETAAKLNVVATLVAACEQALALLGTDEEAANGCGDPTEVAADLRRAIKLAKGARDSN